MLSPKLFFPFAHRVVVYTQGLRIAWTEGVTRSCGSGDDGCHWPLAELACMPQPKTLGLPNGVKPGTDDRE